MHCCFWLETSTVAFRTVLDELLCFFLTLNLTSFQYFCQESFFFCFLVCFSTKICPENSRENPAKSAVFSAKFPLKSREISLFFPANYQKPCQKASILYEDKVAGCHQSNRREGSKTCNCSRHKEVHDCQGKSNQIIGNVASESKSKQLFNNQRTRRPKVNRFSAHRKPKILNPQTRNPSSLCVMLIIGYHIANPIGKGHFVQSRKKERFCKANGCTSKHSTFLHSCTK